MVLFFALGSGCAGHTDKDALNGNWQLTSITFGGKEWPVPDEFKDLITEVKDLKISTKNINGKLPAEERTGTFSLDTTSRPRSLDLVMDNGPDAHKRLKAIYKLEGDALTVCFDPRTSAGPADFVTTEQNTYIVAVLKRLK
jgi:uncharacterized protein (TIGR03067 family)